MTGLHDTLIVPVDLAALCVGETDVNGSADNPYGTKDFSRLSPDFSLLPYASGGVAHNSGPYLSTQALADTFQEASIPLDVGIHLHWALPDALTHGTQDVDGSIGFQKAPDRWLILRIVTNSADPRAPVTALKAWVLESNHLWDRAQTAEGLAQNKMSLATPTQPKPDELPNKSWMTLGRVFDYEGWAEDPVALRADLTALGYGDPTYAASYQLCPNVFGFWDTLSDLDPAVFPPASSRVGYLLMGWHASLADDPMSRITYPDGATHDQQLAAIAEAYSWTFASDTGESIPTRTAYNALMTSIPWDRKTRYIDKRTPSPESLEVAVGNTTPEALSAMLAAQPNLAGEPHIEQILNALQLGLLSRLQLPGGLRMIDEAIHQAGFASTSDGTLWAVQSVDGPATMNPISPGQARRTERPRLADLPGDLGSALNDLNSSQAGLDRLRQDIDSLRGRIFTDWCNYMQIEYAELTPLDVVISANDARTFIQAEVEALQDVIAEASNQAEQVAARTAVVEALLTADFQLVATDGPRFWGPTDPVVLFSGDEVKPPYRYNPTDSTNEAGDLICRIGTHAISALTAATAGTTLNLPASALPSPAVNSGVPLAPAQAALTGEAFFLDPVQSAVLAAGVAALGGAGNPAVADFAAFRSEVEGAQRALFNHTLPGPVGFDGTPPSNASFKIWEKPWIPIILQWEIEHFPTALPPYPETFITRNYDFGDGDIDLRFKGSIPVNDAASRSYDGTIVLTHNTEINIRQQIEEYIANSPDDDVDDELRDILDKMELSMQAQALSGFNDSFLQLARILQMGVSDPLGILKGQFFSHFTNVTVKHAVAEHNTASPLPNTTFSPVRDGGFRIPRARVVDAFGQPLDITSPKVIRSENLIPPAETQELINLPVRMTQPIQLNFDWVAATTDQIETNSVPATTPIFGWVLFNHLDRALTIYDEMGEALGSFNQLGPFWQGAPGNQAVYNKPIDEVFAHANRHLRNFALGVASAADPVGYLTEMLRATDKSLAFIAPGAAGSSEGLSVLIGRPIALVRAALNVNALGLPAVNQSKAAFNVAIEGGKPLDRDTGGATGVQVPVRLGELSDLDDGLVGYFIDDGEEAAYRTFYSPVASDQDSHGVVIPAFDQIRLTTQPGSAPLMVSMMIDPNAAIHATTGLMPMKELTIPSSMITDALESIAVTFLATPILGGSTAQMPVPEESGYAWSWVTQEEGVGKWKVEPLTKGNALSLLQQQVQEGWLKLSHVPDHGVPPTAQSRDVE